MASQKLSIVQIFTSWSDLLDFNVPDPRNEVSDPKIEVSGPKNKNISNQKLGLINYRGIFKYKDFLLGPETSILGSETPFLGSGRLQKARSHREDLFCSIESFWRAVGVDFEPFSFFMKILIFKYSPVLRGRPYHMLGPAPSI